MKRTKKNPWQGKCFAAAGQYQWDHPETILVHGTVLSGGREIAHAWIEDGDKIVDLTITPKPIPKDHYHRRVEFARYTYGEAIDTTGLCWGPWDERTLAAHRRNVREDQGVAQ